MRKATESQDQVPLTLPTLASSLSSSGAPSPTLPDFHLTACHQELPHVIIIIIIIVSIITIPISITLIH